ncbi:MAG: FAS1-like dehydratase domain-containing protein [Mycobacteriales bacterium]
MVDTTLVGKPLAPSTVVIERGPVTNFAAAVKSESPIYRRPDAAAAAGFAAIPAPPTFGFAMAHWGAFPELQPAETRVRNPVMEVIGSLMSGGGLILHGEQEFHYHRPIVAGDQLSASGQISDLYEKTSSGGAKMTFLSSQTEYRNAAGELMLTAVMTLVHRA